MFRALLEIVAGGGAVAAERIDGRSAANFADDSGPKTGGITTILEHGTTVNTKEQNCKHENDCWNHLNICPPLFALFMHFVVTFN